MKIYESQHCADWSTMLPEFRDALIIMVLDDFRAILNPTVAEEKAIVVEDAIITNES